MNHFFSILLSFCSLISFSQNPFIKGNFSEIPERGFRPDILVHKRGTDGFNLIAIEVKKDKECPFDEAKLRALTKPFDDYGEYGYELGVFIWFPENIPSYKWFVGGVEIR